MRTILFALLLSATALAETPPPEGTRLLLYRDGAYHLVSINPSSARVSALGSYRMPALPYPSVHVLTVGNSHPTVLFSRATNAFQILDDVSDAQEWSVTAVGPYSADRVLFATVNGRIYTWGGATRERIPVAMVPESLAPVELIARVAPDRFLLVGGSEPSAAIVEFVGTHFPAQVIGGVHSLRASLRIAFDLRAIDWGHSLATHESLWIAVEQNTGPQFGFVRLDLSNPSASLSPFLTPTPTQILDAPSSDRVLVRQGEHYGIFTSLQGYQTLAPNYFDRERRARNFRSPLIEGTLVGIDHHRTGMPWLSPPDLRASYVLTHWREFASERRSSLPNGTTPETLPATLPAQWIADLLNHTALRFEINRLAVSMPERLRDVGFERDGYNHLRVIGARQRAVALSAVVALLPCDVVVAADGSTASH